MTKKDSVSILLCYILWGFQPLYWTFLAGMDSFFILGVRIVMAALFSVALLVFTGKLSELKALFKNKDYMRWILPATLFLLLDWAVYLVVVNAGHVLDAGIGYYANPLLTFGLGILIYKEKVGKIQLLSLGIAAMGLIVSTVAFGSFPVSAMLIAFNWAVYTLLKKNVKVDGVVSIAAETLILTPFALAFLLIFRGSTFSGIAPESWVFLVGSGIVTALPMYLYSNCVARLPLIVMCLAQYMSPTFNVICGFMMGERFSASQLISFVFFVAAIVLFTVNELKNAGVGDGSVKE